MKAEMTRNGTDSVASEKEKVWLASLFSDGRRGKRKGGSQKGENERLGGGGCLVQYRQRKRVQQPSLT